MAKQAVVFFANKYIYRFYLNKTHHLTSRLAKRTVVVFNVYSVAVQIEIYITTLASLLSSTVKLSEYFYVCIYIYINLLQLLLLNTLKYFTRFIIFIRCSNIRGRLVIRINYGCGMCKNGVNDVEDKKYVKLGCDKIKIVKEFFYWGDVLGKYISTGKTVMSRI